MSIILSNHNSSNPKLPFAEFPYFLLSIMVLISIFFTQTHAEAPQDRALQRKCFECNYTCDNYSAKKITCRIKDTVCFLLLGGDDDEIEYRGCVYNVTNVDDVDCEKMKLQYNVSYCYICASDLCNSEKGLQNFEIFIVVLGSIIGIMW